MKRLNRNDFAQRLDALETKFNVIESQRNAIQHMAEILEARRVVVKLVGRDGDYLKEPTSEQMQAIAELLPNIPADRVMHVISEGVRWHNIVITQIDC